MLHGRTIKSGDVIAFYFHKTKIMGPNNRCEDLPQVVQCGNDEESSLLNKGASPDLNNGYGCAVNIDSPPPSPHRRTSRDRRGSAALSQSANSYMMPGGKLFGFKDGHLTTIVADGDLLSPETALNGSSKLAVNAMNEEMRRISSIDVSMAREKSISMLSHCTVGSIHTVRTLKEVEEEYEEYLAKTR